MLFWEIGSLRKPTGTYSMEPFDPLRMKAHFELSGRILTQWEYNTLIEMDLVFRSTIMARRS